MPRVKKPVLATYKMVGYSPHHPMPIHFVGFLKEGERYVTIGMSIEEAEAAYEKFGSELQRAKEAINGSE